MSASAQTNHASLIVHIVYRLDTGGMERLLVDLIKRSPSRFRHTVIALTETGRLGQQLNGLADCHELHKKAGKDVGVYLRLWQLLRRLKPALVQTYNYGCIDMAAIAWLAGIRRRLHAEHGWNANDANGGNRKYQRLRRLFSPFIHRYIAVSNHAAQWLERDVHIPAHKIVCIRNGIDIERFSPDSSDGASGGQNKRVVIGTVGRLDEVKDQRTLLRAFRIVCDHAKNEGSLKLAIIGDGPMRSLLEQETASLDLKDQVWFAGERDDIPALLAEMDVFVLSSISEGIPLSVLEAMASGKPVVATAVGGLPEVIVDGQTGRLVAVSDPEAMAQAIEEYIDAPDKVATTGRAARRRIEEHFSLKAMVSQYTRLYDAALAG